ncbi:hypothetical protein BCV70DRAFT_217456 [Testicularia cyperi]|uniref:Uncharacterized protein n=1 Tax=Testicularia cyperi TaxID=1882483 RepID=A0A317XN13_9BASI|nr:hypothetical protein BCV70DRAFT_217456 [Testicularia cyperi]
MSFSHSSSPKQPLPIRKLVLSSMRGFGKSFLLFCLLLIMVNNLLTVLGLPPMLNEQASTSQALPGPVLPQSPLAHLVKIVMEPAGAKDVLSLAAGRVSEDSISQVRHRGHFFPLGYFTNAPNLVYFGSFPPVQHPIYNSVAHFDRSKILTVWSHKLYDPTWLELEKMFIIDVGHTGQSDEPQFINAMRQHFAVLPAEDDHFIEVESLGDKELVTTDILKQEIPDQVSSSIDVMRPAEAEEVVNVDVLPKRLQTLYDFLNGLSVPSGVARRI